MRATVELPAVATRFAGTVGTEAADDELEFTEELEELDELDELDVADELEELEELVDELGTLEELERPGELDDAPSDAAFSLPAQPARSTKKPASISPCTTAKFGRRLNM